ncbi:MAG: HNH endonuclease [Actinomycetota bacterium]|nr:HNH endonuclease [Actinomycetota bacterium]
MATTTTPEFDTASAVLGRVRARRADADRAERDVLVAAIEWAQLHPVESIDAAAVLERFGDQAVAIAGPGAPLVAEFAVAEFASAMGLPTRVGAQQLGEAVELCDRLPRVGAGDLQAWRARRIARVTICLSLEAAAYVDAQVARFAHRVGPSEVDRLVQDANCRHMPAEAEARRRQGADGRHFTVEATQVSFTGTSWVHGELDRADAVDLEHAVAAGAASLAACGSAESLDVRRSMAVGELARRQLTIDLTAGDSGGGCGKSPRPKPRQVVLHVHLAADAVTSTGRDSYHPSRVEQGLHLVTAEQVRQWCGNPDTQITVKPVVDLNGHLHVTQYEVPDRLAEQAEERDLTCVFPWCSRPADGRDKDHVIPFAAGGETSSENIADLCRRHHRLKTHSPWAYSSNPAPTCGPVRTACSSSATTPAPSTSPVIAAADPPTSSGPAPHPASS